jgi:hypothetical protein
MIKCQFSFRKNGYFAPVEPLSKQTSTVITADMFLVLPRANLPIAHDRKTAHKLQLYSLNSQ